MQLDSRKASMLMALLQASKNTLEIGWLDELISDLFLAITDCEEKGEVNELRIEIYPWIDTPSSSSKPAS